VLHSENGLAALRSGLPLESALKASRGDERLLRDAIVVAEQKLKDARGLVLTGYQGDTELLKRAEAISLVAESIRDDMEAQSAGAQKARSKQRGAR
jgi:hypothetical protein